MSGVSTAPPATLATPNTLATIVPLLPGRQPSPIAIVGRERSLTYAELHRLANAMACELARRDVRRGDRIVVALERSPESVAALLGIARAGAAFVPVDPFAPRRRLREVCDDARPALVIASERFIPMLNGCKVDAVSFEGVMTAAQQFHSAHATPEAPDTSDLAYIMYTSGSTGTPKGVMIEHGAVAHTVHAAIAIAGYRPSDRVYQLAAWTFDPAMLQIFGTLAAGAQLVLSSVDGLDFGALATELVEREVTIFDTVPAVLEPLLDQPELAGARLRVIGCGGSIVRGSLRDRCIARLGVALHNHYGPTEAAILATTHRTSADDDDERVPIGVPLPGVRGYVLDADGRRVEPGARGELFIGGAGVGRGYVNLPELTAARFVLDPFASDVGARMYRTGDFVRERIDGTLEFEGRLDRQVKVRGVRIELEDVERELARHERVRAAAAAVHGEDGSEAIVAFVTARDDGARLEEALAAHVRETLPPAAQPSRITVVDELPLLSSGKIDVSSLPLLAPTSGDVTVPGGTLSDAIARIWRDVLGHAAFGIDDDFFAIGGNSLAAAQCAARIAMQFGRHIPIGVLFADATVAGLADVVRSNERRVLARIVPIADGEKTPLFFFHGDYTGVGLYVRRFGGRLDPGRPIFALTPHGADGGSVPPTLDAMAVDHLSDIRRVQPHGPYLLGGYCMGAMVALEVARSLEAAGERVVGVIAIDAHEITPRTALRRVIAFVRRRGPWAVPRTDDGVDERFDPATAHVARAQDRAIRRYHWRPLAVPVAFLCSETGPDLATIERRWRPFLRRLSLRRVRGDHTTILTQYVAETCAAVAEQLERMPC